MLQDKVIDIVSFYHDTFIGFGILVIIVSIPSWTTPPNSTKPLQIENKAPSGWTFYQNSERVVKDPKQPIKVI